MFSNRTILLTGVGREGQVGEAVARGLAERNATVILVDRGTGAEEMAVTLRSRQLRASAYQCDLTDETQVASLARHVQSEAGDLDAAVLMAGGFAMSDGIAESTMDVWNRMMAINLTTAYLSSRALVPLLRARRGALVYFASEAVLPGVSVAGMSAYAAAKSGVVALMRAVAQEEAARGVRANALAPAAIRTAANVAEMGADKRYVEREEVEDAVAFLCSPEASAVSGQVIRLG
jgi:NAD(P)-dependent dehydrogenase (short-subunit alcohol dehydrogenase family)